MQPFTYRLQFFQTELVIRKAQRVILVNPLAQKKSIYSLVQSWLAMMQKVCKIGQIIFTDSGNDVIIDDLYLG